MKSPGQIKLNIELLISEVVAESSAVSLMSGRH